tara:strand:- start:788 stop:1939 length:1152 start_codon:yes stop_codon:yes gene_type:complete
MAVTKENIATKKNAKNKLTQNNINTNNSKGSRSPSGHPKMMVYPTARGTKNITGDSLLIKCLEYIPPQTTSQAKYRLQFAKEKGKIGDINYNKNDLLRDRKGNIKKTIDAKSFKMINRGASDQINAGLGQGSQNEKTVFFVELPIPQDVNDSNTVTWGDDNLNILQLAGLAVADTALNNDVNTTFDTAKELLTKGIFENAGLADDQTKRGIIAAVTGKAFDKLGTNISASSALGRATGMILNSNLELLFDSVNLRTFPFSINFSPRTPEESMTVKHIIRAFKSSMAAKKGTSDAGQGGIFLRAPDVFQLRYLHRGKEHPFLNSFKHCALTGMTVNYTGAGTYASYEDGTPVSIKMSLTFKELNPIYFEDYDEFKSNDNSGVGF